MRQTATLVAFITFGAAPAASQIVTGEVFDPIADAPVTGAFVSLLDESGERLRSVLTDEEGRFTLIAPRPGRFTLTAQRIGQETVTGEPFVLAAGESRNVRLDSPTTAIVLDELSVESDRRCAIPADRAAGAARVWDEVRKALEITLWAKDNIEIGFRSTGYNRAIDPALTTVQSETLRSFAGTGYRSWSTPPPDSLVHNGFARADGDSIDYFGPDAEVLLSDVFQDHHCFELVEGSPGMVGLRFTPMSDRGVPDIEGTLWVERSTGMLDGIEYRLVHAERLIPSEAVARRATDSAQPHAEVHGFTGFRRLDNGVWYVDRWWIRMPVIHLRGRTYHLAGWKEEGGLVLDAQVARPAHPPRSRP